MRRSLLGLFAARIKVRHLVLVSIASAAVSAVIVASALRESPAERAVIAALRARQIVHAPTPAGTPATSTAAATTPAPVATQSAPDGTGDTSTASTPGADTGGATSTTSGGGSGDTGSGTTTASTTPNSTPTPPPSKVKHVFVLTLAATSYREVFGAGSPARYLNTKLRPKGELLSGYHTLGSAWLPDLIAMVSGQSPNADTRADCTTYSEFAAGTSPDAAGLVAGPGCVYPNTMLTLGDQFDSATVTWRAYVDGMGAPCQHPDSGSAETAAGAYLASRNPFVYFHSLLDLGDCQSDDLPLPRLAGALGSYARTPRFAFIAADPCDAGAAGSSAAVLSTGPDSSRGGASVVAPACQGTAAGIAAADAFLHATVPGILRSPAYKRDGALLILFTAPGSAATAHGPVRTGALVMSPFTKTGSTDAHAFGPFSVLRTLENVYGLSPLGRAARAHGFDRAVFTG